MSQAAEQEAWRGLRSVSREDQSLRGDPRGCFVDRLRAIADRLEAGEIESGRAAWCDRFRDAVRDEDGNVTGYTGTMLAVELDQVRGEIYFDRIRLLDAGPPPEWPNWEDRNIRLERTVRVTDPRKFVVEKMREVASRIESGELAGADVVASAKLDRLEVVEVDLKNRETRHTVIRLTVGGFLRRLISDTRGALNPKTAAAFRNTMLDTVFDTLNSGKFRVYDGTQPTDADTALGAQVLLADLALNATAFAAASAGSKAANAITADSSADATGTASWASLLTSGSVRKMDMSVGTSGANINMNSVAVSSGAQVSCSSLTVTMAA